jgi:hypothetical protein
LTILKLSIWVYRKSILIKTDLLNLEQFDFQSKPDKYMKTFLNLIILILSIPGSISGSFYRFDGKQLILDNGSVRRIIEFPGDTVITKSFFIFGNERNYLRNRSPEFQFAANERIPGWMGKD